MKSERRHELEHNELADWTVKSVEKIKPYTNVIVGGTIAVVILAVGITLWTKQSRLESETAWTMYYAGKIADRDAGNPEVMQEIASEFPSANATPWAIVAEGDMRLGKGLALLFVDKADATEELDAAIKSYESTKDSGDSVLDQRAAFGLARAYEAKGDLVKAKAAYETMQETWKDGVFSVIVKERLNSLSKESTKEFYNWFAKYEPVQPKPVEVPDYESTKVPELEEKSGGGVEFELKEDEETVITDPAKPEEEPKTESSKEEKPEEKTETPKKVEDPKAEAPKEEPKKKEGPEKTE